MLDVRAAATTLAMLIALVSVALADAAKDKSQAPASNKARPVAENPADARPIRAILPASWEPGKGQAEAQSTK